VSSSADFLASFLRAIVEHAPEFLNVISPEGIFQATGRTSEAFGSVIGRSVFEFTDPSQHQRMREAYARACETRKPVVYESTGYGENGEPNHSYVVRAVPVVENDAVKAIVLFPTDITERVRLERSLAQSEQKLRFAVDATRMGLWSWDPEQEEIIWNDRLKEIFGVEETPANFADYLALIHPDDRQLVRDAIEGALKTGAYTPFEHRVAPRADGVERWVLGTGTVLRGEGGKVMSLMGGGLDITTQKRAGAQLLRAQRVEALGQLTAGLAHNFNNLLGAIIPNLELAQEVASHEQAEPLSAAKNASLQARDLIKRLMSIAAPRVPGAASSCNPREVLERVVAICRSTFPREVSLSLAVAPDVSDVRMDASELEQVLLNLLFNARDALERTTNRQRQIELAVEAHGAATFVRLIVRDNGVGMSPAIKARIFEPFFTTKPSERGSGLGLADALVRVQEAGGTLECQSVEGQGTSFFVSLPGVVAPLRPPSPAASAPPLGSRGESILIVDDEPAVSTAIARLLKQQGYRVLEAQSAEEARAVLSSSGTAVKLVLLDQSMPSESGPEALPSLKRLSDAPVVLFTGGATAVPPGAAGLLAKPVLAADLLRTVHDMLRSQPS
jgi:PAS domain S-box-containing protein